jgi:LuxR family maltose regulon positive regulatory protein
MDCNLPREMVLALGAKLSSTQRVPSSYTAGSLRFFRIPPGMGARPAISRQRLAGHLLSVPPFCAIIESVMALRDLVIRSQLIPPRQRKGVLRRPRLEARLKAVLDYPLTLVQAGTGYGKSTALADLANAVDHLFWYAISEPDRDPLLFLAHLICAFEQHNPAWCAPALSMLEESGGRVSAEPLTPLLNALTLGLDREAVLVLDDYHLVADVADVAAIVEQFADYLPPRLHLVISSRKLPPLAGLTRWQVKGQILTIARADLAFTADEIETLFRTEYGYALTADQARALATETEGWAIALQMVWQSLQSGAVPDLDSVLGRLPATLEALFDYLAQDVLARQPAAVQRFLLTTSVLRQMDGPTCDALLGVEGSDAVLDGLLEGGLFVVSTGEGVYRYHRLFHDFLRAQLDHTPSMGRPQDLHRQAAATFQQSGRPEEVVYHLLQAEEYGRAAGLLEDFGPQLVALGRFDSLTSWIASLPERERLAHPAIDLLMGDVLRLRANFDGALVHYAAADQCYAQQGDRVGRSRALRGQAQVYLDTVRPLKADSLLEEALRLLEPEEHRHETAALLDLLAENRLNLGYPDQAQALHHEARLLRTDADPGDIYLEARALMRTGRLVEAERLLARRAEEERQADRSRPQRFHRETQMLLSLVHVLQGNREAAERSAREGIAISQRLDSGFVKAVGHMRLGHAAQLDEIHPWDRSQDSAMEQARAHYREAIEQVEAFKVMRTQVEPIWGLCRAESYDGNVLGAERYACQALEIAQRAGDEWICDLIQVSMGAGLAMAGQSEKARDWLDRASRGFEQVGDLFGQSAAWLWLALDAWWQGDANRTRHHLKALLPRARERGYDALLTRRTFLGVHDDHAAAPLLIHARREGIERVYAGRLLEAMGLAAIDYHPGYSLAVRTLGTFTVWRGTEPIAVREWRREKARQVFQLLVTCRGQWFHREQIVDLLWPHLPPEAAERDFKVALNAVHRALEPIRPAGEPPFFVVRKGSLYGLNPAARVAVDADVFERQAASEDSDQLRRALALYEDDYLPDSLYEDWSSPRRQKLHQLYLAGAERVARHLLQEGEWDAAIQVCHDLLERDTCWEAAYRLLMRAYAAQENRAQVHTAYQQCVAALHKALGVEPAPATRALLNQLT